MAPTLLPDEDITRDSLGSQAMGWGGGALCSQCPKIAKGQGSAKEFAVCIKKLSG